MKSPTSAGSMEPRTYVRITPTPALKKIGFKTVERYEVDVRNDTWNDVLKANGIEMDKRKYCLKNSRNVVISTDEKVSSFVQTYKMRMTVYKVRLTENTRLQCGRTDKKRQPRQKARRSPKVLTVPQTGTGIMGGNSAIPISFVRPGPSAGISDQILAKNRYGFPSGASNVEDAIQNVEHNPVFPQGYYIIELGGNENNPGFEDGAGVEDFDDTASQFSQDSQMDLDDIKTSAVARLGRTPNSVCTVVRDEIRKLKQRSNYMKISGYIPATINLLTHLFEDLV